jgi:hypothetical protein
VTEQRRTPAALRDLLAPFALGAVDDEERAAVEALLARDPAARAEVHGYRRASAILEFDDGPSPEVWDRIQAVMRDDQPETVVAAGGTGVRRLRPRRRHVAAVVAVAAAVLAASVWGVGHLEGRSLPTQPVSNLSRIAHAAERAPGARRITVSSTDGATTVQIVVLPDGRGYVLGGSLAHATPRSVIYALFATTSGAPALLSVLGHSLRVTAFQLPPGTVRLAIGQTAGPGQVVVDVGSVSLSGPCPGSCAPPTSGGAPPTTRPAVTPSSANGSTPTPGPTAGVPTPAVPGVPVPLTLPPLPIPLPIHLP